MSDHSISNERERVIERLRTCTTIVNPQIGDGTEIYRDLHVSGDDLYDFIEWVHQEFRTDFSAMDLSKYAPGEGVALFEREYQSLTVGAVLHAIAIGAWPESEMKHDPLGGLSSPAKAFVVCVGVVLIVISGLAVASTFFFDVGPLTEFLRLLAFIGFLAFMFWGQRWFARVTRQNAEWGGGPLSRTLDSTRALLGQQGKRPSDPQSSEERP